VVALNLPTLDVSRLPQFQVAACSLLLLASILCSGFHRTSEYLPLPKWRRKSARPSLTDLLSLLRDQIFARGAEGKPLLTFDDFADSDPKVTKSPTLPLAADTLSTSPTFAFLNDRRASCEAPVP